MATIDLKKLLSTALKNNFWEDFMDVLSQELETFRSEIAEKKDFFNVRNLADSDSQDRMIEMSKTFGFTIDRSIDETTDYLENNLNVTSNRIKHKTSYTGYNYIFNLAQYYGLVYNYFLLNDILTRGIDLTTIITNLNAITDYSLPFIGFEPELYFKSIASEFRTLDETVTWTLDGTDVLRLDQEEDRFPTIHLAVEYVPQGLITVDSTEYLMNTTYLDYLQRGSLYNKKVTEIPHIAPQVNCIMDTSGMYDNLSNSAYSTDLLKLNCATTDQNEFISDTLIYLDLATADPGNMDLDKEVLWRLDQGTALTILTGDITDVFDSAQFGNSNKGIISKDYPDLNEDLIGYWDFDEIGGAVFNDSTIHNYTGNLSGIYTRELGIIGYGVNFDGSSGLGTVNNIYIEPTFETFSFWLKAEKDDQAASTVPIMHMFNPSGNDYLEIEYNTSTENLTITMTGNTIVYNTDLLDDTNHHIAITYDNVATTYSLFIDGAFVDSQSFGGSLPPIGLYNLFIATEDTGTNFYNGILDELRFYGKELTNNEITFLYTSRLGNLTALANTLYTKTDGITIREEDTDWFVISARLDFSEEIQTIIDDNATYPTEEEQTNAINALYEEEVTITECGLFDINGQMVVYTTHPPILMKKKYHISYQFYIKKP